MIFSSSQIIDFSMSLFKDTWKIYDNEQEARHALSLKLKDIPRIQEVFHRGGAASTALKSQLQWCARWPSCGFPTVSLKEKRASAFATTGITKDVGKDVVPPWPAFLIKIPEGFLEILNPQTDTLESIENISVLWFETIKEDTIGLASGTKVWSWVAWTKSGLSINMGAQTKEKWVDSKIEDPGFFDYQCDSRDERAMVLIKRIIAGVCLHLNSPEHLKLAKKRGQSKNFKRNTTLHFRKFDNYVFGEDTVIDARNVVSKFLEKGGKSPTVQSFTRGHWRTQRYGKNSALKKWINIEGYWRGPEAAPIKVRKTIIKESSIS